MLGLYMSSQKVSGTYSAYLNLQMDEIQQLNRELSHSREELRDALDAGMNGHISRSRSCSKPCSNFSDKDKTHRKALSGAFCVCIL